MFIDTHAHLGCKDLLESSLDILERAKNASLEAIINVSCTEEDQVHNILWTKEHIDSSIGLYNTLGYHPDIFSDPKEDTYMEHVTRLLKTLEHNFEQHGEHVVAIGECGLDYYRTFHKEAQKALLKGHIMFAKKVQKPLIIHLRGEVYEDFFELLEEYPEMKSVVHCFGGTVEQAKNILKFPNMMISFTGVITFKNAVATYKEIITALPMERIMIETDSPYLAPVPYRGKVNEPANVVEVAKHIAELRGVSLEEVEKITTENAKRFFGI